MSLRTKALLLFLSFVTLPLILLGVALFWGAHEALDSAIRRNLEDRIRVVALGVDRRLSRTAALLESVSRNPAVLADSMPASSEEPARDLAESILGRDAELSEGLDSIQVRDRNGSILASARTPHPVDSHIQVCTPFNAPGTELVVELESQHGTGVLSIVGFVSPSRLLSSAAVAEEQGAARTILLDRQSGAVVSAGDCPTGQPASSWMASGVPSDRLADSASVAFSSVEGDLFAYVDLGNAGWTVGSGIATARIGAPLDPLAMAYGALVLLIAAAAILAFNVFGGRLFRSFHELREAVEQIGQGDFAPWLPPPASDEIGWLSLSIGRMTERMKHMVQSVEQFGRLAVLGEMAAHVAHEIRTPLSSIKLNLQRLSRDLDAGVVPESSRRAIESGIREVDRLEGTVRNILQLGPTGEDHPRRPSSLHELIVQSVDVIGDWIEDRGLSVELDLSAESDRIRASSGRIRGVFLNLLMNAADATPEGGEIMIETQLQLREDGRQMIAAAVTDSGSGVPPAIRNQIFNPFFTTKEDGNGLGLAAALKTAREHGGDLFLSDHPDGHSGGCFVVVLPLFPEQGSESDHRRGLQSDSSGLKADDQQRKISSRPDFRWRPARGKGVELD